MMSQSRRKFSELFKLFLSLKKGYIRESTRKDAYEPAGKWVEHQLGDRFADEYTALEILEAVQRSLSTRKPGGVNATLRVLRVFGNWAIENELLPEKNPFARVKLLRVAEEPTRFLSHEEFRLIYNAEKSPMRRNIYLAALWTGCRCGDIVNMRWEQFEQQPDGKIVLRLKDQKTGRLRSVPVHPDFVALLERIGIKGEGYIFGKKYTVKYISHAFKKAAKDAGVQGVSFHTLRKTCASWLVLQGVDVYQVSRILGHSNPGITAKYYAHLAASELHGQIAKLMPITGSAPIMSPKPIEGPEPIGWQIIRYPSRSTE